MNIFFYINSTILLVSYIVLYIVLYLQVTYQLHIP